MFTYPGHSKKFNDHRGLKRLIKLHRFFIFLQCWELWYAKLTLQLSFIIIIYFIFLRTNHSVLSQCLGAPRVSGFTYWSTIHLSQFVSTIVHFILLWIVFETLWRFCLTCKISMLFFFPASCTIIKYTEI